MKGNFDIFIKIHKALLIGLFLTIAGTFIAMTMLTIHPLVVWIIVVNCVTLLIYAWDKRQAGLEQWRIPEKDLLLLGLIGGSLGALIAINKLRHKSQKLSYQAKFALILLIQIGLIGLYFYM